jgi:hypothetical protein
MLGTRISHQIEAFAELLELRHDESAVGKQYVVVGHTMHEQ